MTRASGASSPKTEAARRSVSVGAGSTGRRLLEVARRGADRATLEALAPAPRDALAALLVEIDRALERGHTLVDERRAPDDDMEQGAPSGHADGGGERRLEEAAEAPGADGASDRSAVDARAWRAGFDAADILASAASIAAASDPPGTLRLVARGRRSRRRARRRGVRSSRGAGLAPDLDRAQRG